MFAKVAIFLAALAAAQATAVLHGAVLASTGTSVQSRQQDSLGNFAFRYDIADGAHVRSHAEVERAGATVYAAAPAVVAAHAAPAVVAAHAAPAIVAPYAAGPLVAAHAAPAIVPAPLAYRYGYGNGLLLNHGLGYGKLVY